MPRCAGTKRDGGQCTTIVPPSLTHCYQHDPDRAEERRFNASRAARARHDPEIREIKKLLKDLYSGVLEGRVDRAAAAVANQIANTRLRALEVERRMREQDELEERLDELEDVLEEAERRRYVSRR
jgi:DNA gyrase/topoisomerase IV subunit A